MSLFFVRHGKTSSILATSHCLLRLVIMEHSFKFAVFTKPWDASYYTRESKEVRERIRTLIEQAPSSSAGSSTKIVSLVENPDSGKSVLSAYSFTVVVEVDRSLNALLDTICFFEDYLQADEFLRRNNVLPLLMKYTDSPASIPM